METCSTDKANPRSHRRRRTVFSPGAISILQNEFHMNPYPDASTREYLAQTLGVGEDRIQVWFQNKRSRSRIPRKSQSPPSWQNSPADLPTGSAIESPSVSPSSYFSQSPAQHQQMQYATAPSPAINSQNPAFRLQTNTPCQEYQLQTLPYIEDQPQFMPSQTECFNNYNSSSNILPTPTSYNNHCLYQYSSAADHMNQGFNHIASANGFAYLEPVNMQTDCAVHIGMKRPSEIPEGEKRVCFDLTDLDDIPTIVDDLAESQIFIDSIVPKTMPILSQTVLDELLG